MFVFFKKYGFAVKLLCAVRYLASLSIVMLYIYAKSVKCNWKKIHYFKKMTNYIIRHFESIFCLRQKT